MRNGRWGFWIGLLALALVAGWLAGPTGAQWAEITTNAIKQANTAAKILIDPGNEGLQVGTSGSPVSQIRRYIVTLNPTALAANGGYTVGTEQNFTVTGLATTDTVFVSGPAPTTVCAPVHWRVSSTDTLTGTFVRGTTAVCTPATGVYRIYAIRDNT